MNLSDSSLHNEKENVLAGLASFIKATDKVTSISRSPEFPAALACLNAISESIETAGFELTTKRTLNCR